MLGKVHSVETLVKMSDAKSGKTHSAETLLKMSEAKFGLTHSEETKAKISAKIKEVLSDSAIRTKMNVPKSEEHKAKLSAVKGTAIFVYDINGTLINTFSSFREAAIFFNSSHPTISKYSINGELFQGKWILSTSAKE